MNVLKTKKTSIHVITSCILKQTAKIVIKLHIIL